MVRRLATARTLTVLAVALVVTIVVTAIDIPARDGRVERAATACPHDGSAVGGRRLWRADMEQRSLGQWRAEGARSASLPGGGYFISGSGSAQASRRQAHTGAWSAELVLREGRGGVRLFRWHELRRHRDTVVRVWLKITRRYRLTASSARGRFWNVFQFKSRSTSGRNDPLWFVNLANAGGRQLRTELVWWSRTLRGPHRGQSGFRRYRQRVAVVPIGRWFQLTARLRQSRGFDGLLCVWQDDRLLFARQAVRTSYSNCAYNRWCAANEWSVNNYSDGLSPAPSSMYADDATITSP